MGIAGLPLMGDDLYAPDRKDGEREIPPVRGVLEGEASLGSRLG